MIGGCKPDVSKNQACEEDKHDYAVFNANGTEWEQWSVWIPLGRAKSFLKDALSYTEGDLVILKRITT